ncbi:hypothetical protein ACGFZK_10020 [Streptomyces sp. NPDC048257]|uniref:hypothetical protein n=1 Tax=Streptomyces sp. NPDC048257 TaxID=3365526 RepID=UPI00372003BC
MSSQANPGDPSRGPVISIHIQGDARLHLTAPVAQADHGSNSRATATHDPGGTPVPEAPPVPVAPAAAAVPLWHRTSVIWSAVAAAAAVATAAAAWFITG